MAIEKNKWYAFVPNLVTIFNLLCGACGLYFAFKHQIDIAFALMAAGALFDFADGFIARMLKVSGELGKQLDSLADVVTFGLLPGAMIFSVQLHNIIQEPEFTGNYSPFQLLLLISSLIIPALSALRLAKFNIDIRQSNEFLGLPTPANALFFASIAYTATYMSTQTSQLIANSYFVLALTLIFPLLMITELPLISLKFKNFKLKQNRSRYALLLLSILILILLKIPGISIIIILYIALSFVEKSLTAKKMA